METVKQLNKQEFTTKVADIEKSKGEWKFLGERPAVIDFFATWCGPCREELSRVQKDIIDRFKGNEDFVFLPVSRGETRETVAAFRESIPNRKFTDFTPPTTFRVIS